MGSSPAPLVPVQHLPAAHPAGRLPAGGKSPKSAGVTIAPVSNASAEPRAFGLPVCLDPSAASVITWAPTAWMRWMARARLGAPVCGAVLVYLLSPSSPLVVT